jgi:hypothetical protein
MMLVVDALSQQRFPLGIQWQQIKVIVGPPVQYAAVKINSRINQRVGRAAIFRLNVKHRASQAQIRVVPEKHKVIASRIGATTRELARKSRDLPRARFDRLAAESLL